MCQSVSDDQIKDRTTRFSLPECEASAGTEQHESRKTSANYSLSQPVGQS